MSEFQLLFEDTHTGVTLCVQGFSTLEEAERLRMDLERTQTDSQYKYSVVEVH